MLCERGVSDENALASNNDEKCVTQRMLKHTRVVMMVKINYLYMMCNIN